MDDENQIQQPQEPQQFIPITEGITKVRDDIIDLVCEEFEKFIEEFNSGQYKKEIERLIDRNKTTLFINFEDMEKHAETCSKAVKMQYYRFEKAILSVCAQKGASYYQSKFGEYPMNDTITAIGFYNICSSNNYQNNQQIYTQIYMVK